MGLSILRVTPLASESLGVRSMATCVETEDVRIVIDPAVALAPKRFGLPPHPTEERARELLWARIKERVAKADVLIVTHYHYDHVDPKEPGIYRGKIVLLKHPRRMINPSQKERAASFIPSIRGLAEEIKFADNRGFKFGGTEISFSKPVPHGSNARRGYVVEVGVEADGKFLHTSDVQGPLLDEHMDFIMSRRPDILLVDGPSTYINSPFTELELRKANENLLKIIRGAGVKNLIVDHHLTRDRAYRERIGPVIDAGRETGVPVQVAAEFLETEPNLLEARREELYGKEG
jgi:predicted metallo-beta-lactamase superfamily hydrolase